MNNLLNLIIEKKCQLCGAKNEFKDCLDCHSKIHDMLEVKITDLNYKNATLQITFGNYKRLKKIIECGKFKLNQDIFEALARIMSNSLSFANDTVITFIPSSFKNDQQKGYNPAYELANHIGKIKELPVFGLMGANNQSSQINLSKEERIKNVKNKFFLKNEKDLSMYSVCVIVDDVITTGATMMAVSDLLSEKYPHLALVWVAVAKT